MTKHIGVLTAGGDSPGLNAVLRGIGKAGQDQYRMQVTGFRDGFRGLMENRTMDLDEQTLSGIAGDEVKVTFVPHLLPTIRGLLATVYIPLGEPLSTEAAVEHPGLERRQRCEC